MQRTSAGEVVIIPRNFKLLEELEKSEKGHGEMAISFGLTDPGDTFLSDWNGGILGPHGVSPVYCLDALHSYFGDKKAPIMNTDESSACSPRLMIMSLFPFALFL
eukprot:scaffold17914_cov40-Attheya_sp.AAC.3